MTPASWLLWAEKLPPKYDLGRIQTNADWILPIAALVVLLLFVHGMYRRDAVELPAWLRWLLMLLRVAAFVGLLVLYLQPERRAESIKVHHSRVLMLLDSSRSMGLNDATTSGTSATAGGTAPSRLEQAATALKDSPFLTALRRTHDVWAFQFNNGLERDPLGRLSKVATAEDGTGSASSKEETAAELADKPIAWDKLVPAGTETRLGEALKQLLDSQWGAPLSAVVLLSDGGQNAGVSPEVAVAMAAEAGIPVYTIGLGSEQKPVHVNVYDLAAPARAYPGDPYKVTGYLQAQGLAKKLVTVELLSREAEAAKDPKQHGQGRVEDVKKVVLGNDGEIVAVPFELRSEQPGRRTLCLRVQPPKEDRNPTENFREAEVEVVDRKNRVLLLAGGPMRDYQFLHTLLYRDHATVLDILLQTAQPGISQEAHKLLDEFPTRREALYDYDCIVAFDPDWKSLRPAQVDLLYDWVNDQGGGLIVVGGPVFTGATVAGWVQDPALDKIRILYPVEFYRQPVAADLNVYASREPWPLKFTREGQEAEFLWLGDTSSVSQQAWSSFPGVYSVSPVRGPKAGARVLAEFSDPRATTGGQPPPYFAEQFFGSGRVFYMGSGEMWRLRQADPLYFDQFFTKLIRHVSQGRLLRGSPHGSLLLKQQRYLLGSTVEVEARRLSDPQFRPAPSHEIPLRVVHLPYGPSETAALKVDKEHPGNYKGQIGGLQSGDYRCELALPGGGDQRLTATFQVVVPQLESENPQRNDALLSDIARKTHGKYYVGMAAAMDLSGSQSLARLLPDRTKTEVVPADRRDPEEVSWRQWLMIGMAIFMCSVLCLEWLIRRLAKLA